MKALVLAWGLSFLLAVPAYAVKIPRKNVATVTSRDQQLDELEGRINTWDDKIAALRKRASIRKLRRSQTQRLNYTVLDLEKRMEGAREEFRTLKSAFDRAWDVHKASIEMTLSSVRQSYEHELAE